MFNFYYSFSSDRIGLNGVMNDALASTGNMMCTIVLCFTHLSKK